MEEEEIVRKKKKSCGLSCVEKSSTCDGVSDLRRRRRRRY